MFFWGRGGAGLQPCRPELLFLIFIPPLITLKNHISPVDG